MTMQAATNPIQPLRSSELAIEKPTPGQMLLADGNGKVRVQIRKLGNGVRFFGRIYDATVPPNQRTVPDNAPVNPSDYFELSNGGSGTTYSYDATVLNPTNAPRRNNRVVVVGAYDSDDALINGSEAACGFMLMPRTFQVNVSAKCCIWMTFAPTGTVNQQYNESVQEYLPVSLGIPDNASQILLEAISGEWRHDPAESAKSDANGRSLAKPLEKPNLYRDNPALYAQNFTGPNDEDLATYNIELNKLIAFLDYGPENYNKIIKVGNAATTVLIPSTTPRPSFLQLAFHDGFQWSNNSGSVSVKVTWS